MPDSRPDRRPAAPGLPPGPAGPRSAHQQRGLLLLRDTRGAAIAWARRGLAPLIVVPGLAWTLVAPAGPPHTAAPYDDELAMLGGRPAPRGLRPSACLVADPDRLAIRLQGPSWRAPARWLIWTRGMGLTRVPDLEPAPARLLSRLLAPTRTSADRVLEVLARDSRHPGLVADELLESMALPGAGILSGRIDPAALAGALRVEPQEHLVARFQARAVDEDKQ